MGGVRGSGSFQDWRRSLLGRSIKVPLEQVLLSFLAEVVHGHSADVQPQWHWSIQAHHPQRNCRAHLGTSGQCTAFLGLLP